MKKKTALIALVLIAVIAVGGFLYFNSDTAQTPFEQMIKQETQQESSPSQVIKTPRPKVALIEGNGWIVRSVNGKTFKDKTVWDDYTTADICFNATNTEDRNRVFDAGIDFLGNEIKMIEFGIYTDELEVYKTVQDYTDDACERFTPRNESFDCPTPWNYFDDNTCRRTFSCITSRHQEMHYETGYEIFPSTQWEHLGNGRYNLKQINIHKSSQFPNNTKTICIKAIKPITQEEWKFDLYVVEDGTNFYTTLDPWWQPTTYDFRIPVYQNGTINESTYSINNTAGIRIDENGIWSRIMNETILYSTLVNGTGNITFANATSEKYWENETATGLGIPSGFNPTLLYPDNVAVYHLGEPTSNNYTDSLLLYNQTNQIGEPNQADGIFGNGTVFEINDGILFPDDVLINATSFDGGAVSMWVKFNGSFDLNNATQRPWAMYETGGDGLYLEFATGSGALTFRQQGNDLASATTLWNGGVWYHIFVTWGDNGQRIYINGTEETSNAFTGGWDDSLGLNISLGDRYNNDVGSWQGTGFNGTIDEYRLWDRQITAAEIRLEYYNGALDIGNQTYLGALESQDYENFTLVLESSDDNIFEAEANDYSINITTTHDATVSAELNWNGTITNMTSGGTNTTSTDWYFNGSVFSGLVSTNNTAINLLWNFTFDYHNGTVRRNQTTVSINQNIFWSYYFNTPTANNTNPSIVEPVELNSTLTSENVNAVLHTVELRFNNTTFTTSNTGDEYTRTIITPVISIAAAFDYNFTTGITQLGNGTTRNSATSSITVNSIRLTNCSDSSDMVALRYWTWNEEAPTTELKSTFDITILLYTDISATESEKAAFNFSYVSNETHHICLNPNSSVVFVDTFAQYHNEIIYETRHHFLHGQQISNATFDIDIFLLNTTFANNILFTVQNAKGIKLENMRVEANRFYPGDNLFRTVDMGITDENGETILKLRGNDVYHVMEVWQGSTLLQSFQRMVISATEVILSIISSDTISYWEFFDQVSVSCTPDNTTFVISCAYEVLDGTSQTFTLLVKETETTIISTVCDVSETGSSGTILCNVGDWTNRRIRYTFHLTGSDIILWDEDIATAFAGQFGSFELIYMVLLLTGIIFTSLSLGTSGAAAMGIVGMITGLGLGLLSISTAGATAICIVLIIVLVRYR